MLVVTLWLRQTVCGCNLIWIDLKYDVEQMRYLNEAIWRSILALWRSGLSAGQDCQQVRTVSRSGLSAGQDCQQVRGCMGPNPPQKFKGSSTFSCQRCNFFTPDQPQYWALMSTQDLIVFMARWPLRKVDNFKIPPPPNGFLCLDSSNLQA
jgi:hypothetical protein